MVNVTSTAKFSETLVISMIQILGKVTSRGYSVIVVETILNKLVEDHPTLAHIKVKTTPYDLGMNMVIIDEGINEQDPNRVGKDLNALINRVDSLTGEYPFKKELWFYLNPYTAKLKELKLDFGQS